MVASINSVWLGLGTITLGWTLLILVGLGVKSILARRIYRPAYQSRTRVSSQRASAPPQGIELHHLNGQQGTTYLLPLIEMLLVAKGEGIEKQNMGCARLFGGVGPNDFLTEAKCRLQKLMRS